MSRINTLSNTHSDADSSVNTRDLKSDVTESASLGGVSAHEIEAGAKSRKKIHVGWSLLAFALFCAIAWGAIYLLIRAI